LINDTCYLDGLYLYFKWSPFLSLLKSSSLARTVISPLDHEEIPRSRLLRTRHRPLFVQGCISLFAEYGERLELVIVKDITKDGAFDENVKGVDAITHTASPFHYKAIDPGGTSNSN
jgi:hypothetical protein